MPDKLDPTYRPNCWLFGYTLPGQGYFGNAITYPQNAVFHQGAFGAQIAGLNVEDEYFRFISGTPVLRIAGPWPNTPDMSVKARGPWGKRLVFYERLGKPAVRQYTAINGAAKECLVPTMLKLMEASFIWHLFDDATKRRLDHDAVEAGLRFTGYNWFTKLYITNDERWMNYV